MSCGFKKRVLYPCLYHTRTGGLSYCNNPTTDQNELVGHLCQGQPEADF
jgi:hypothetical protein